MMDEDTVSDLTALVKDLPKQPGVYLWKDKDGEILYIGKAKELRKRVPSYLRKKLDRKTWNMMQYAADLETIITNTEREALLLEATLIRKHQPKYNLALKDDRRHAWIRVDLDADIPTFEVTREIEKDGATYYGPYGSTKRLDKFLDTVRRFIPVAMCRDPTNVKRACMDFHLGRCIAPCSEQVPIEEYREAVQEMCLYLEGREEELTDIIREKMEEASRNLEYEKAANLRDRLLDIDIIMRKQKVVEPKGTDKDVLGLARTEQAALIEILLIRSGRLVGHDNYYFEVDIDTPDSSVLQAFVEQFYFTIPRVPEEILLPIKITGMKKIGRWLGETVDTKTKLHNPKSGRPSELVEMANKNAYRSLRKILLLGESDEEILSEGVKNLKEYLDLSRAPLHIEGFDIANIQGTDPTGSCVVFHNGEPDNSKYRMFKIRSKTTPDDYAMMYEVVYRRYRGVLEKGMPLPDLIIIDGGKGQLNVAQKALEELGLEYLNVAAIAKNKEILYTRNAPGGIFLPLDSDGLFLVQQVRDEAHRFAQRYHHKLRERRFSGSILEDAPGIGPKRRNTLLQYFGSYDKIRRASINELRQVEGMTEKAAASLRHWIDSEDPLPR
ncbi:excinuclease ABC subunit UvrC [Candidatus Thorarchaeota archaeon]|nr:MAG: excinuclease ABC subunit UvrC [Candidatus Thorarchaeota archaeon]